MMIKIRCSGYTMVEITIAVVIVSVMAAIAIPHIIGQQEKTVVTDGVTMLNALRGAQERYALEHNGSLPLGSSCSSLDVPFKSTKFKTPVCNSDGSVQLTRFDNSYVLKLSSNGSFTCTGACTAVSKVVSITTTTGSVRPGVTKPREGGSGVLIQPGTGITRNTPAGEPIQAGQTDVLDP